MIQSTFGNKDAILRFCFVILVFAVLLFGSNLNRELRAQEITRVAVLNYSSILNAFPRQSRELQRINDLRTGVETEMSRLKDQLTQLQEDLKRAQAEENNGQIRRLQNEINKQRDYGRKYVESKNEEIQVLQQKSGYSSANENLLQVLPDIVSQVAREQGYSLIMDKGSQNIIWFDASIDITEIVLQRLRKRLNE